MIITDEEFKITYLDQSTMSKFNRCPAAFLFGRLMSLHLPEATSIHLDYGTDMHLALPHCYNGEAGIKQAMDAFLSSWNTRPYGSSDDKRNPVRAEMSLRQFAATHNQHNCPYDILDVPISARTRQEVSENEIPFLIDIGGPLAAAGRIDLVIRWRSTGDIFANDYKTSSEISARLFDNFNFCPQTCLSTIAAAHIFGPVRGMAIEAIRVSASNVENQISLNYVFPHQLTSFLNFANRTAEDIIKCNNEKCWPKKCTGCGPYSMFGFPSRVCEFTSICNQPDWRDGAKMYVRGERFHPFEIEE